MSFPVFILQDNGQFVATLIGDPTLRFAAPTRREALAGVQVALEQRYSAGEVVFVDVPVKKGILALAGKYQDDESLQEICDEIYRQRDAEPKE